MKWKKKAKPRDQLTQLSGNQDQEEDMCSYYNQACCYLFPALRWLCQRGQKGRHTNIQMDIENIQEEVVPRTPRDKSYTKGTLVAAGTL